MRERGERRAQHAQWTGVAEWQGGLRGDGHKCINAPACKAAIKALGLGSSLAHSGNRCGRQSGR